MGCLQEKKPQSLNQYVISPICHDVERKQGINMRSTYRLENHSVFPQNKDQARRNGVWARGVQMWFVKTFVRQNTLDICLRDLETELWATSKLEATNQQ